MRDRTIEGFLEAVGWIGAERRPLADDASFRRYFRLLKPDGSRAVLMDAPPPAEDVRPFIGIAERLLRMGFSPPRILAADVPAGLLLIEDLGDDTYTRVLAEDGDEAELYRLAVDTLIALHRRFGNDGVPRYDESKLLEEAALLVDWYLPAVRGEVTPAGLRKTYLDLWRGLLPAAYAIGSTLVLRDFHVDNLMLLRDRSGVAACGLLDFQDAVVGPVSYDLVSLLEDARRDVPAALTSALIDRYLGAFPALDRDAFLTSYAILGAQRSAKIVGIFTRLDRRDGKPDYLLHIPRVWRWLEGDLRHPALAPMREWFDRVIPPEQRIRPAAESR